MLRILTDDGIVVQHSRPDGALQGRWRLNDINEGRQRCWPSASELGDWTPLRLSMRGTFWMVPRHDLRLSAGVELKTMKPLAAIPTHLGSMVLLERNGTFSFVELSSFLDGLCAVRQRFKRELEEGRRACTTAEEKVANLRKCREAMNAYSEQVVTEHMTVLPVEWEGIIPKTDMMCHAVLRLTTPDGCLVDSRNETSVAVVGNNWHVLVRFGKDGKIDAEWLNRSHVHPFFFVSPSAGNDSFHTKAVGQHQIGIFKMLQYVRDPDSNTDAIQVSQVLKTLAPRSLLDRRLLTMRLGCGATGRWLVFRCRYDVAVYDSETDKMADLRTPSLPSGVMETSEGLWMWGAHSDFDGWSKLFKVDTLLSLSYRDLSMIGRPEEVVQRRVKDEALDDEAFCESRLSPTGRFRNKSRHPGHYWVVAGYGPVPASLRAPDHIYKQLATAEDLKGYQGFPFWSVSDSAEPWAVQESWTPQFSAVWAGAVDVRDGVTAESIKEDPTSSVWRVGVSVNQSGEFAVTGKTLSTTQSSSVSLEVPVTAGKWLWRFEARHREAELTLWHESVSDVDIAICTMRKVLLDLARFKCRQAQLDVLAPLIPEEGVRAKIAEFTEWVYTLQSGGKKLLALVDKKLIGKQTEEHALTRDDVPIQVAPLTGGVGLYLERGFLTFSVGENVVRIAATERETAL